MPFSIPKKNKRPPQLDITTINAAVSANVSPEKQSIDRPYSQSSGIRICSRPTKFEMPILDTIAHAINKRHVWVETQQASAGMGEAQRNYTNRFGWPPRLIQTELRDHESERNCRTNVVEVSPSALGFKNVNADKLNAVIQERRNTYLGPFLPGLNDCHTVVHDLLKAASIWPSEQ